MFDYWNNDNNDSSITAVISINLFLCSLQFLLDNVPSNSKTKTKNTEFNIISQKWKTANIWKAGTNKCWFSDVDSDMVFSQMILLPHLKMSHFFLRRSRPNPSQHVPDCSDQPCPGQPACPGCHGTCCHTHRQHCHTGRPSGGGCNAGAVTIKILEGVGGTERPPWGFVYPTFFQDITLCTMSIYF